MKDEYKDTGLMEQEIVEEENPSQNELPQASKETQKQPVKIPTSQRLFSVFSKLKSLKGPKFITLVILFLAILTTLVGLVLLSLRTPQNQEKTSTVVTLPTAEPTQDPELEEIKAKVSVFQNDLDSLNSELENIKFPQIDLNLDF